jgi:nitrite reductase/ring-hydroxylating ferredoxin subunit
MSDVLNTDCTDHVDCAIDTSRRDFLRHGLLAVAALTAVAGSGAPLHAMARTYATGALLGDELTYPVPAADGATIDGANKVILVRFQGAVSAFSLECPHRKTPLEWQPENARFYCPKHKSTFKPEGTLTGGKAERNMDRFAVRLAGDKVAVNRDVMIKSSVDAAAWAAAVVKVG